MENFVVELPSLGTLEISGEDAGSFLQAQFTSDVSQLRDLDAQFSAWCNPQGRIIANFIIFRTHDSYLLILPCEITEKLQQNLSRYILRSRVRITDKTASCRCVGIYGSETKDRFKESLNNAPPDNELFIFDIPADRHKRSIVMDMTQNEDAVKGMIDADTQSVDEMIWHQLDIEAGISWINRHTTEKVLPQEIFLDQLGGLSYNKGCFPGQEIIARLHFRSQLKNKLYYGIIAPDAKPIAPGASIYADSHSRKAGIIINTVKDTKNRQILLAVVDSNVSANTIFFLEDGNRIQIQFLAPDYPGDSV